MKKAKVLIVEDDNWLGQQYRDFLKRNSFDVELCRNSQSAMEAVDDFNPDVMIVDILLEGTTVFALLHELRSYKDTADIPIIVCSNLAESVSLEKLEPYGVKRILDKTIMTPDDMLVALKAVL